MHRVWSSDWWEERDKQLDRICIAIEEATRKAQRPEPLAAPTEITTAVAQRESADTQAEDCRSGLFASQAVSPSNQSVSLASSPSLPTYRAKRGRLLGTQEDFYDSSHDKQIRAELVATVTAEGPIRLELAADRVADLFAFERTRQKVVDRIGRLARDAGIKTTKHGERTFLWPSNISPEAWTAFRVSQPDDPDARNAVDLPPHEVANAAAHLLDANGACPPRELLGALKHTFGFKALGTAVVSSLEEGISLLISSGRARIGLDERIEPIA
jgi:hypothetical protein